ncbi:MAG TPA: hypothetical protein VGR48_14470 [Terriglobales bacterium]|nr:hypothetical protein [Terriglobales bacterium]
MNFRRAWLVAWCVAVLAVAACADSGGKVVDSGSFGIFREGKRVATETFRITQEPGGSTATFQLKMDDGSREPSQTAQMELTNSGALQRYEWHQLVPEKADAVVTPNDPFLMERLVGAPGAKPVQQPFLVPPTTVILDNNFFAMRELLAWRYMAGGCKPGNGGTQCKLAPEKFGVLVPQALNTATVTMESAGWEKIPIRGVERSLIRLNLKTDNGDWALWLDSAYKLVRMVIAGDHMEVLRD